jgi:hypothetical protein
MAEAAATVAATDDTASKLPTGGWTEVVTSGSCKVTNDTAESTGVVAEVTSLCVREGEIMNAGNAIGCAEVGGVAHGEEAEILSTHAFLRHFCFLCAAFARLFKSSSVPRRLRLRPDIDIVSSEHEGKTQWDKNRSAGQ